MRWPPILLVLIITSRAQACLWDFDTIRDERRGLPNAADILSGRWERHSPFYYRDRIARMKAQLATNPADLDAYDNLAVAYEKVGDDDSAIATITAKDRVKPGQYTTCSNLGTFLMHKGNLQAAIDNLRKALAINPDAHFGREEYQLRLAEFLHDGAKDPSVLTNRDFLGATGFNDYGFAHGRYWVSLHNNDDEPYRFKPNLMDGIIGMIRFGPGQSAELYLVLGELLEGRDRLRHAGLHLAYRAYLRAIELNHPRSDAIRAHLRDKFDRWIQTDPAGYADTTIAAERADAARWVQAFQDFEDTRARAGQDPTDETALAGFYAAHPRGGSSFGFSDLRSWWARQVYGANWMVVALLAFAIPSVAWKVWNDRRRRRDVGKATT